MADNPSEAAGDFPVNDAQCDTADFWPIIPAGGAGTRLWPLSRASRPKFLHDLTGAGRSLLQSTADRLAPLAPGRLIVVTGQVHEPAVRAQLPELGEEGLIAEPLPRDSMAAIGLAAAVVERRSPDAVIGSFAADHVVGDEDGFRACVQEAVRVARTGLLVTLGIRPTFASTGFGYINVGPALSVPGAPRAHEVRRFVEKPDAERAEEYLRSGEYRWNAGMFVVKAGVLLDLLAEEHPDLAAGLRAIAAEPQRLGEIWPGLTKISIDHAVAEPAADAGRVAVVETDFPWDDVGDFHALADLIPDADGMRVVGDPGQVVAQDASGIVVPHAGRIVAVVGLDDVVVVDTPDAVLVTTRERAQDVKAIVDRLKAEGRAELT
ncbi:Mannose-1-phosphate guanylyltransferase 1 [Austwickia sp. TVS 96-490-7B]|uniref:mannose-1-phosphate guanylyltransferase n=1 Tax=Austwickia sp. TVS 96-490-7B TaxID=2830843 RepID=UPI001C59BB43|nr:mannose-1-phosphate guanylyltransferase [Austwickia sp. TVS 96-490-7B]MBW3084682.1 Mannose-1-phosphate guanylyltransferase 1 [Austwickia sp. TVS 96-490-7B]